jgi:hypothetical protein
MRRAARLVVLYVLEAIAALLALLILAGGALLWRLAEGPLDADILRPTLTNALIEAVDGDSASIGQMQLQFDPAEASLLVIASDVRVMGAEGAVLIASEQVTTGLALDLLLTGRASPVSISARGGSFSVVRTLDGRIVAGFGDPQVLDRSQRDALAAPRDLGALTSELDPAGGGMLARLQRLDLRSVDLRLLDEATGLDWLIAGAGLDVDLQADQVRADLVGDLITSAGPAPLSVRLDSARDLESVFAEMALTDFVPAAAAPQRGLFAPLSGVEASFDARLVFDASVEDGLRTVLLDVGSSAGEVRVGDQRYAFEQSQLRLEYDAPSGAIELQRVDIQSDLVQLDLTGRIFELGGFVGAVPTRARLDIRSDGGIVDLGGIFPDTQVWDRFQLQGRIDTTEREIVLEALEVALPYASGQLTGRFALEDIEGRLLPSLALSGPIEGVISKTQVLRHWPVDFALGARDWVRDSILDGRLSNARLDLNIPATAIAARALDDEHLSLAFDFEGADVRYVSTMTPLIGLSGSAELRGNSLSLQGRNARIGALDIATIFVELPRLNPKGSIARFGGTGTGDVSGVLTLLSEPPLSLAESYGIDPAQFDGTGELSFEIRRPMYRFVPVEDIGFAIEGRFEGVTAPTGIDGVGLENGVVAIEATQDQLVATGTADLAGARIDVEWTETFGLDEGAATTRVLASGTMSARGLDRLGLPARRFLDGAVDVTAELVGNGFEFSGIDVGLDLEDAIVVLPAEIWEKPAGAPGEARLGVAFDESGALQLDPLIIAADGIDMLARASIGSDGRLLSAEVERLVSPGRVDVALMADRPEGTQGPLRMALSGDFIDAGDLFSVTAPGGGAPIVTAPIIFEADLDRVFIRDVVFEDVSLSAQLGPTGFASLGVLAGNGEGETGLRLTYAPDPDNGDQRLLSVVSEDAGQLLTAFADFNNIEGGRLQLDAIAPAAGVDGAITGDILVEGFTLERLPLLARILAAGSLEGLGGLLSGEGIEFERLESDFSWADGTLGLDGARAAGPSLGATWRGVVSFEESRINVDGTLLPSYGANSILGGLPVIGELLTSRRGEGVFGVTFSVTGPFDETRVITNPLAAFAPGVFRRVFEGTAAEQELDALRERQREAELAAQGAAEGAGNGPANGADEPEEPTTPRQAPQPEAPEAEPGEAEGEGP